LTPLLEPDLEHIGGVFEKSKNAKLMVWVTADEARIPVKVKSEVIVGSFVAELIKVEGRPALRSSASPPAPPLAPSTSPHSLSSHLRGIFPFLFHHGFLFTSPPFYYISLAGMDSHHSAGIILLLILEVRNERCSHCFCATAIDFKP
jgi:hypothetical protein